MDSLEEIGMTDMSIPNWPCLADCRPEYYFEPKDVTEIRRILAAARLNNKHVRVVGSRHSFNNYMDTNDYVIHMEHFQKILEIDKESRRVKVQAGVILSDLNEKLDEEGIALDSQGVEPSVTVAGVISTATHGSGRRVRIMADSVLELELITAAGEIRTLSEADGDTFLAAKTCLGTFGIILSCTIQCVDAFNIERVNRSMPLEEALDNLDSIVESNDFCQVLFYPYTGNCLVSDMTKVDLDTPLLSPGKPSIKTVWGLKLSEFVYWLCSVFPFLYKLAVNWYFNNVFSVPLHDVNRGYKTLIMTGFMQHYSMEWAVPRDKAKDAILEIRDWIESNGYQAHFPMVIRFCSADKSLLSPCFQRDVCYINTLSFRIYGKYQSSVSKYVDATEAVCTKYGGRPHWGKNFNACRDYLESSYPEWKKFCNLRRDIDPSGVFLTDQLKYWFD